MDELFICVDIPEEAEKEEYPVQEYELIEDLYCVGVSPLERWRCFINCDDWDPRKHHDTLLGRRDYHARQTWELVAITSILGPDYMCKETLEIVRDVSAVELRKVEFEMMSYQLTCGMIGISGHKKDLYRTSCILHLVTVYITNLILGGKEKDAEQIKLFDTMIEEKPRKADNKEKLSMKIDRSIFAIQELLKHGTFKETELKNLSYKLKDGVLAFDSVAIVT